MPLVSWPAARWSRSSEAVERSGVVVLVGLSRVEGRRAADSWA